MIKIGRWRIDAILLITVTILVIFGVVMIFSASYYGTIDNEKGPYPFLLKAGFWSAVGYALMIVVAIVPKDRIRALAPLLMIAALVCLVLVFTPLGVNINGANRWIGVGSHTFMPGELVKPALILCFAHYYSIHVKDVRSFGKGFATPAVIVTVVFVLIYKQPNLSTAGIIAITAVVLMFIAGVKPVYLFGFCLFGAAGIAYKVFSSGGEHMSRIMALLDPFADAQGESYQVVQGLLALGSGGLKGVGLGGSVQKALWLPEANNDFIFAIIGEETGFIGCLFLIAAFTVLIWRCALITMRARDRYSMLVGAGVTTLFSLQIILNIAVVTSVFPPTGVILPFISYGGNAMVFFLFMMGVMLRLSDTDPVKKKTKKKKRKGGPRKARGMEEAA
ncbi:MAG: putative lipid II flippase FtsW [Clostridiales Family XIII bacterium]|nr:putative lipid II flippase FtsW [Clostridiales Family XIII bacterium]